MNDYILSAFLGVFFWFIVGTVFCAGYVVGKSDIREYEIKCVEMREMPLGACSKLFGEKQ